MSSRSNHWLIRGSLAALLGVAWLALPARGLGAPQVPQGVFSIANSGKQPQAAVLANPDVDGVTLRQDWASLEPTEGNFDFSFLDTAVASVGAVGKKVLIRIGTQSGKPAWVTTAIQRTHGLFFTFTPQKGVVTTIPVFWDPTFLAKKTAMISSLGAHFTNNPTVAVVVASFANATSEDWNVPHTPTDVTNWLALGYTSDKLIAAGQTIINATMNAFPNQIVTLAVGGSGHVKGTNLDPTADYVPRAVVGLERIAWPGLLNVQKNDLSTFNPVAPGTGTLYQMISDFQPDVAGQMVFQCLNDPTYRVNNGVPIDPALALTLSINNAVSYKGKYVEIYQTDVIGLPAVITSAHHLLTGQ